MVVYFTLRSVIHFELVCFHFELIVVSGVRSVSRFIILHVNVQLFQHHFQKGCLCLCCVAFPPLTGNSWLYLRGSILGSVFFSTFPIYLFFASTTLTWLLCLYKSLKSGGVCSPDLFLNIVTGLPWWLSGKEFSCSVGDAGSIPGLGRSTEEGNGNQLQYSWLGNPMVRGAWWAAVGVPKRVRLNKHCDGYSESFPFPYKL